MLFSLIGDCLSPTALLFVVGGFVKAAHAARVLSPVYFWTFFSVVVPAWCHLRDLTALADGICEIQPCSLMSCFQIPI